MFETAEQPVWLTGCSLATRTDELQPFNSTSEFAGTAGGEKDRDTAAKQQIKRRESVSVQEEFQSGISANRCSLT